MQFPDIGVERVNSLESVHNVSPAGPVAGGNSTAAQCARIPLRILLLEDNILCGAQLAQDLEHAGHHVLGPFNDIAAARQALPQAEAAILDVHIGKATSFSLAHDVKSALLPLVFYTGISNIDLPEDLSDVPVVSKPAPMEELLSGLTAARAPISTADLVIRCIPVLRARAQAIHLDSRRAEMLVEAALRAAIRQSAEIPRDAICKWLLQYIENQPLKPFPRFLI